MPQALSNALVGVLTKCRAYFIGGDSSQVELLVRLAEVMTLLRPVFRLYLHSDWQLRRVGHLLASLLAIWLLKVWDFLSR